MSSVAPSARAFQCLVCELIFSTTAALREHHENAHTENELDRIRSERHPGYPRVCPTCYQVFPNARQRTLHMQRSRHFGVNKLSCGYCYRRFATSEEIDEHMSAAHFGDYTVIKSAFLGHVKVTY